MAGDNTTETSNSLDFLGWEQYNVRNHEMKGYEQIKRDFIVNTISIKDILSLPPEQRPEVEITCIDERVTLTTSGKDGSVYLIHINTPGGGTEFLTNEEIDQIILMSNGKIRINSHKFCGWGAYVSNEMLEEDRQIDAGDIKATIEDVPKGMHRIMNSIKLGVDDVFLDKYSKELGELGFDRNTFINVARDFILKKSRGNEIDEHTGKTLDMLTQQAFVHGKNIKVATRFEERHELLVINYNKLPPEDREKVIEPPALTGGLEITNDIDTLEEAPHSHTANHAVINITKGRVMIRRFQIEGENAFFSRVSLAKALELMELTYGIMEGDHSDHPDDDHTLHIILDDEEDLQILKKMFEHFGFPGDKITRKIVFYLITDGDIENFSPLPQAT